MLDQEFVFDELGRHGITFFTGVPDSHLNDFCNYVLFNHPDRNVIAANEGNAIGIASGHYFATREIPLVYMQNSGLGNAVNPLISLANKQVYSVPMILLIGWRGQPGTGDWAQHELQGEITTPLLELMNIPYRILLDNPDDFTAALTNAVAYCKENRKAYGLIVPNGVMNGLKANIIDSSYPMSREEAIEIILDTMPPDTLYSATTGRATRELFFLRRSDRS
jgi:phosphonopyruvate decarboxylase